MISFSRIKGAAHIVVVLETLGRKPGDAIIQIGACRFTPEKGILDTFERSIDMKSSIDHGFGVDGEAIARWFEQNDKLRRAVISRTVSVHRALVEFSKFTSFRGDTLWVNGNVDLSILMEAYCRMKVPFPVHPYKICDENTLSHIAKMVRVGTELSREDPEHSAGGNVIQRARVTSDLLMGIMRATAKDKAPEMQMCLTSDPVGSASRITKFNKSEN